MAEEEGCSIIESTSLHRGAVIVLNVNILDQITVVCFNIIHIASQRYY